MPHKDPKARKRWQKEYVLIQLELDEKGYRERRRKSNKKYRSKPEVKAKEKTYRKIYDQEHRKEKASWLREWRKKNPEKVKAQGRRYHERYPEKRKKWMDSWRASNREHELEYRERTKDSKNRKHREKYHENIVEFRKKNKIERDDLKREIMLHYSPLMECQNPLCNVKGIEFLTIDHTRGRKVEGHSRLIRGEKLYRFLRRKNYPKEYQVLCWNCNQIKELKNLRRLSMTKSAVGGRERLRRYKIEVLSHYSKGVAKCSCCGFSELNGLSIDHIEARKKVKHRKGITSLNLYTWLRNNVFPKGYQVLCFNCNSAKSDKGICPHELRN